MFNLLLEENWSIYSPIEVAGEIGYMKDVSERA